MKVIQICCPQNRYGLGITYRAILRQFFRPIAEGTLACSRGTETWEKGRATRQLLVELLPASDNSRRDRQTLVVVSEMAIFQRLSVDLARFASGVEKGLDEEA
jgi:hypothetical protein